MVMQIIIIIIIGGGGGGEDKKIVMVFSKVANVKQSKENKFSVTSFMYLYSNRSWATTNHSALSFHCIKKDALKPLLRGPPIERTLSRVPKLTSYITNPIRRTPLLSGRGH